MRAHWSLKHVQQRVAVKLALLWVKRDEAEWPACKRIVSNAMRCGGDKETAAACVSHATASRSQLTRQAASAKNRRFGSQMLRATKTAPFPERTHQNIAHKACLQATGTQQRSEEANDVQLTAAPAPRALQQLHSHRACQRVATARAKSLKPAAKSWRHRRVCRKLPEVKVFCVARPCQRDGRRRVGAVAELHRHSAPQPLGGFTQRCAPCVATLLKLVRKVHGREGQSGGLDSSTVSSRGEQQAT